MPILNLDTVVILNVLTKDQQLYLVHVIIACTCHLLFHIVREHVCVVHTHGITPWPLHRDYPRFFEKLYGLLQPSVFYVKYMQRFFALLDTFLRST